MRARGKLLVAAAISALNAVPGYSAAIHEAVKQRQVSAVETQLARDPSLREAKDDMGRLPFHWAIMIDEPRLWTLTFAPSALEAADSRGVTPLLLSITNKSPEALTWLLERKVDVNSIRRSDPLDPTPLHWAAAQGRSPHVSLLLAYGASINATNLTGSTPLHRAAKIGEAEVARLLLKAGANPNARNVAGATPLIFAAANDHPELVALLLQNGADPSLRDRHGKSALDYAAESANTAVMQVLREPSGQ